MDLPFRFALNFSSFSATELRSWNRTQWSDVKTEPCESWVYNTSQYHSSAVISVSLSLDIIFLKHMLGPLSNITPITQQITKKISFIAMYLNASIQCFKLRLIVFFCFQLRLIVFLYYKLLVVTSSLDTYITYFKPLIIY